MAERGLERGPVPCQQRVECDCAGDVPRRRHVRAELSERGRDDVELRVEGVDEDEPQPEVGNRACEQSVAERRAARDPAPAAERAEDSKRDADQEGEQEAEGEQLEGRRQSVADVAQYRATADEGVAEVALDEVADVLAVLRPDRLVEAEALLD